MDEQEVTWSVDWVKAGVGFCARRSPNGGLDESPTFPTQDEVCHWLEANGLVRSDTYENLWVKPG